MGTEGGRKIIPGREKEYRETTTVGVRDVLATSEVVEGGESMVGARRRRQE